MGIPVTSLIVLGLLGYISIASVAHRVFSESLRLRFENLALRREAEEKSLLLGTTLQAMQQGISLVDQAGRLRLWNPHFLELLGLPPLRVDEQPRLEALLQTATPPLTLHTGRLEYRRADGAVIEVLQAPMPDGGRVLTYTDISTGKQREAALEQARLTADQANAAKTRFLAAASHDLRQPIHALGLFFSILADRVRTPETEPLVTQIEAAIEAIDTMLNALLDISKLDAEVVHPQVGPVAVAEVFKRLDAEFQPLARETSNALRVRPCQAIVSSDAAMLERILRNLIANALRYTSNGRVVVAARHRGHQLRIAVYDTGCGIPADQLEAIFLEFHQLGNPARDRRQGLGLGLAIVQRLADLLGHAIQVRSRPGRGSCFSIFVDLASAETAAAVSLTTGAAYGRELQGRRVLIVEDDSTVLTAMSSLLAHWGCQALTAGSVEEAQQKLTTQGFAPELLIMDYRLPGPVSGLEAVAILQKAVGGDLPALVITGDTAPERLREAQASGYPLLHKPVQPAKLRSTLRYLLGAPGA